MESEKNSLRNSLHSNIHIDGRYSPDRQLVRHERQPQEKRSNPSIRSSPRSQPRSPNSEEEEREYEHKHRDFPKVSSRDHPSDANLYHEYERKVENLYRTLKSIEKDVGDVRAFSKVSREGKALNSLKRGYDLLIAIFEVSDDFETGSKY